MPHFFACPAYTEQQQQQRNINALDPFLQALFSQLQQPEETESTATPEKPAAPEMKPTTSRPIPIPRKHNRTNRAFSPRFDVYETDDAYHLYGDLPGVSDKKSVGIEFSDQRTLMVRGRVERSMPKSKPTTTISTTITIEGQQQQPVEEKRRSLNPTVEDTDDEDDYTVVSAGTSSVEKHEQQQHKEEEEQQKLQQEEKRKVWLAERTFGNFQRTFSFPTPVALEDVSAKLENGLLEIVVPKVRFGGVRRIEVE
ncbi:HSP20-like chaperone [Trichophaea hybrida]|nr:HSP20-like chaperone [Trichophaea hybrida]